MDYESMVTLIIPGLVQLALFLIRRHLSNPPQGGGPQPRLLPAHNGETSVDQSRPVEMNGNPNVQSAVPSPRSEFRSASKNRRTELNVSLNATLKFSTRSSDIKTPDLPKDNIPRR